MARLLIIADDFTGALDTGIQFVDNGVSTKILADAWSGFEDISNNTEVVVVNAETRHSTEKVAYEKVRTLVRLGMKSGIKCFYKKTDSALRGNIGSELQAAMDETGIGRIHFIPALPAMNRTTLNGVQYINEIPVSESEFARDKYSPVKFSSVKEIIELQSDADVYIHNDFRVGKEAGIHVYDAVTDNDLIEISNRLKKSGELALIAGCAGFASVMPELMDMVGFVQKDFKLSEKILMLCGSTHNVTKEQIVYACQKGFNRFSLHTLQKLYPAWTDTVECEKEIDKWIKCFNSTGKVVVDSNDTVIGETAAYVKKNNISAGKVRQSISDTMGKLLKKMLDKGLYGTLIVTGGDTLLAFMKAVKARQLEPICEIETGVVLSALNYNGKEYYIISKSGGFGKVSLLADIVEKIISKNDMEE